MARHRYSEGDENTIFPTPLRPSTVEELAAQERAGRPAGWGRQPLLVALTTGALMISGATAWALVNPGPQPILVLPDVSAAPEKVDFIDGFGSYSPTPRPRPRATSPNPSGSAVPSAVPSGSPTLPLNMTTRTPTPSPTGTNVTAAYSVNGWQGYYQLSLLVDNDGPSASDWQIRIELPPGSTVESLWEAKIANAGGNVWIFTPPRGPLGAGQSHFFGFQGRRTSGPFKLVSCTINGVACTSSF